MSFFGNPNINRLAIHTTLHEIANGMAAVFSAVYLLREGLSPAEIFLVFATLFGLRFALRPIAFVIVPVVGLRWTMVLGTMFMASQYPVLALVKGVGIELAFFCATAALGQVLYWTCYHTFFSALGDVSHRGSQVSIRQVFTAAAGIAGPATGGIMLASFGPLAAFGAAAAAIELAAALPLTGVAEPQLVRVSSVRDFVPSRTSVLLFVTDGWIASSSIWAWHIVMFQTVDDRYDAFGGILAIASLASALSGMILGRMIDLGHMRRIAWLNAALLGAGLLARSFCGSEASVVIAVAILSTLIGGSYVPVIMTTIYNQAKQAPCPFRFQFAIEGGWDAGAFLACLTAAGIYMSGGSSRMVILLALPVVVLQTQLIRRMSRQDSQQSHYSPITPPAASLTANHTPASSV